MNPESHDDWLDEVASRHLKPREREELRRVLADRPRERWRLERELALNDLLDGHRPAPAVSTNFVARVVAEATRPVPPRGLVSRILEALRHLASPRLVGFAALALAVGIGWRSIDVRRQDRMAREAVEMARAASGIDVESFADFEAVRRLDAVAKPDDDALIVALAQ